MLKKFFWSKVIQRYKEKTELRKLYFQQDGVKRGTVMVKRQIWRQLHCSLWPPRSPDLNPCVFSLWGGIKAKIYEPKPANLEELKENIKQEIEKFKIEDLPELVISEGGGHIAQSHTDALNYKICKFQFSILKIERAMLFQS